jgi:hypothetical protein
MKKQFTPQTQIKISCLGCLGIIIAVILVLSIALGVGVKLFHFIAG